MSASHMSMSTPPRPRGAGVMGKSRLEAFSDGVLAIIITIMVLELKVPHGIRIVDLTPIVPVFLSYVLSFIYIGIYWNNHHHMLHAAGRVTGGVLWANLHLLFWLSLFPFVTAWMGENHFAIAPSAVYGLVLLMAAIAYYVLQQTIMAADGEASVLRRAVGSDWKGKSSPILYVAGIFATLWLPWLGQAIYVFVALLWLIPDPRIEQTLANDG
jgi:TMEM175 potassium channel family protein